MRDGASLHRHIDLDSHGVEPWECLLVSGDSSVAGRHRFWFEEADFASGL